MIGQIVTQLGVRVGGTWIDGYSVEVVPQEYAIVEHKKCRDAKDPNAPRDTARGICVIRITKEQSSRFEAAMQPFKRYAVPLESVSMESPWLRPDGKPCRSNVLDTTLVSLTWTGTEGVRIANFYVGCDEKEFASFYKSALGVTDPLPIQQIIAKR